MCYVYGSVSSEKKKHRTTFGCIYRKQTLENMPIELVNYIYISKQINVSGSELN